MNHLNAEEWFGHSGVERGELCVLVQETPDLETSLEFYKLEIDWEGPRCHKITFHKGDWDSKNKL